MGNKGGFVKGWRTSIKNIGTHQMVIIQWLDARKSHGENEELDDKENDAGDEREMHGDFDG